MSVKCLKERLREKRNVDDSAASTDDSACPSKGFKAVGASGPVPAGLLLQTARNSDYTTGPLLIGLYMT